MPPSPSSLASLTVLHWGFYQHNLILDTVEYHRYGNAIVHRHVPFRDFAVEYPPGALPAFAVPALTYAGLASTTAPSDPDGALRRRCPAPDGTLALRSLGASVRRTAPALAFAALAPLVLGLVILYRYDLWPAALTVAGLAAILTGRERLGFASLGLGIAAKVFPAVVPLPPSSTCGGPGAGATR